MKKPSLLLCALALALLAAAPASSDYVASIEKWRSAEAADLQKENGWPTLTGLYWLKEGINTIGAGPAFDVYLTDYFTAGKFGEIDFQQGVANLNVTDGVEARSMANRSPRSRSSPTRRENQPKCTPESNLLSHSAGRPVRHSAEG